MEGSIGLLRLRSPYYLCMINTKGVKLHLSVAKHGRGIKVIDVTPGAYARVLVLLMVSS